MPPALQPITLTVRPVDSWSSRSRSGTPSTIEAVSPKFGPSRQPTAS
jgi:hypothetical protein